MAFLSAVKRMRAMHLDRGCGESVNQTLGHVGLVHHLDETCHGAYSGKWLPHDSGRGCVSS